MTENSVQSQQFLSYEFGANYFESVILAEVDLGVTTLSITQERSTKFTQHILNSLPY